MAFSPFQTGLNPRSIAFDPKGEFAFVANSGDNSISAYTVNDVGVPNGVLVPTAGTRAPTGSRPHSLAVDPTGQFLYVVNAGSNSISGYRIELINLGVLVPLGSFPTGGSPQSIAITREH